MRSTFCVKNPDKGPFRYLCVCALNDRETMVAVSNWFLVTHRHRTLSATGTTTAASPEVLTLYDLTSGKRVMTRGVTHGLGDALVTEAADRNSASLIAVERDLSVRVCPAATKVRKAFLSRMY